MSNYDSWKTMSPDDEAYDRRGDLVRQAAHALNDANARIRDLEKALHEIIDMADEQADTDDGTPNLAMRILVAAEKAL
jgi:hypothetical protein